MPSQTAVLHLTDDSFASEVEQSEGMVVVDFWAPWCAPCRMIAPTIEQLATEYDGRVRFAKLNVDEAPRTASAYGIRSIPTIGIFVDGTPVDGVAGVIPKPALARMIDAALEGEES